MTQNNDLFQLLTFNNEGIIIAYNALIQYLTLNWRKLVTTAVLLYKHCSFRKQKAFKHIVYFTQLFVRFF